MKAILIDREAAHPLLLPPEITLLADSSITPPGRPVFLPDFSAHWVTEFYFALKISRLGKDISLKFAPRYFDSFTVAMRLLPLDIAEAMRGAGRPDGITAIFDNALTIGQWLPLDAGADSITITINGTPVTIDNPALMAAQSVEAISRYCTLKTGDLIMPMRITPPVAVASGSEFTIAVSDTALLTTRLH